MGSYFHLRATPALTLDRLPRISEPGQQNSDKVQS
uniref:Uncharacterized protein n=1 Tax=Arundo donax TaxID=35708 RepID=A0A0A8XZX4_ARUDO